MFKSHKVVSCNYCGARAALDLRGKERHELACAQCAAPLHFIKHMPVRPSNTPKAPLPPCDHREIKDTYKEKTRKKHKSKKKSFKKRFFDEIFDVFEDAFDDLID